ncbi:SpaA isopeptide-forming pilin-related protein [Eubacterium ventriosum]|uniref:Cna protein B-type domain protein n=1 Tax=Eubacterium ventriosum ATCC 27560 TaxID=411463 RepID=A5Z7L7_9FIRM|nr:SpaA isopeptide-forming pilin-related protein [Eubacterium ventriosum]EDM50924.1 Cna protein B-type domain protein [Eubacterium ventriosum ATCC 27560]UWP36807.1 SpaA isopeptide-forming pilin-related protein [Eubacterium ventriosum]
MFNKMKKMVAGLLATIMITTNVCPMFPVRAASGVASLESLGKLGTVNIGSKSESGTWLQTQVDSKPVFCMDLGKACHTGYTYKSESKTISSDDSSTKNKLEAKIGYWYDQVKKGSNKAWVYAQCLIWSVEEGCTSESNLKSVINQVKKNTGYYKDDSLYSDIFEVSKKVECDIYIWKYSGTTDDSEVQKLLQIKSTDEEYKYLATNGKRYYRQRITLEKVDEDGNALPKVAFMFTAKNIKELYSYQYNGWGDSVKEEADEDATKFSQDVMTDSNGKIVFRFTYILNSKKYYYVSDDELSKMSSSEKKQMKDLLDDKGYNYASDLSKASAEKLKEADLDDQMDDISNKYVIEEVNSGNDNILTSFVVDKGNKKITDATNNKVTVTLTKADSWTRNSDGKWPETAEESYSNYKLAYKPVLKDKYKKVKLTAVKIDEETGKVAQGDATLEGAVYGVYSDVACTKLLKSYTTDKNYQFETDYMRCGKTYYLKEITPPKGYLKNDKVYDIVADGTNFTAEYNSIEKQVSERPIKGDVAIIKGMGNGTAGIVPFEKSAQFQVYLASAGSYDKAKATERDILTTDLNGYAKSKQLPYGTYVVHQIIGADNTEKCPDFYVNVKENGKTYKYLLNNPEFNAYLKIVKKDSKTNQTVLKAGTTYQIYKVDKDGKETLVTQTHSNVNAIEVVDRFVTDETGEIITYEKLKAGTYKVYEIEGPEGYRVNRQPVMVEINSNSYKTMVDKLGKEYLYAECEYYNDVTYGKFTINKIGPELCKKDDESDYADKNADGKENAGLENKNGNEDKTTVNDSNKLNDIAINPFNYKDTLLNGVVFELTAREDIMSQDNQGTVLFKKNSVVAKITTGERAEFTNDCNGICNFVLNDDGTITLNVPLGEYTLKEVKTKYGYVLPEQSFWDLSFKWNNKDDEYVFDISENSKDGKIDIHNDMVKTDITLEKQDSKTNEPVGNARFGFYSRDNIYDRNGNVIVAVGEKIATVTTDKEGKAKIPFDVPAMDEGYGKMEGNLNSGDYYFLEESVSNSYYINREKHQVHLEYKDQETAVVSAKAVVKEDQTETVISKRMIASSVEIKDCHLKISDENGNEIVSWITGDISSVKLNEKLDEMGYDNVHVEKCDGYAVKIYGLLHDREYTLTETKPSDGFVTASDIIFKLAESDDANAKTRVLIKDGDAFNENIDNQVVMYDDTTKIEFSKTDITNGKELPGCHMQVTEKDTGKVMDEWVSSRQSHVIEGKYAVGKTYVLMETKPRDGYATATSIEFTVADDGKVQKVNMVDDTIKVEFNKIASDTKKQLGGAKYKVYDSNGKKVYEFTTGKKAEFIEGMFKAGETYTFKEVDAPEHYKVAKNKKIKVKDTGKVQKLTVTDERIPVVPDTPQTGINGKTAGMAVSLISLLLALGCFACVRAKDKSKYNFKKEKDDEEDN